LAAPVSSTTHAEHACAGSDALDLLAWQTRHYWQVVDEHTIRVTPDVQTTRRAQEPTIEKTIVPTNLTNTNGLLNILRTVFGLRSVFLDDKNNILLRDKLTFILNKDIRLIRYPREQIIAAFGLATEVGVRRLESVNEHRR
jgi:hypothetical protein